MTFTIYTSSGDSIVSDSFTLTPATNVPNRYTVRVDTLAELLAIAKDCRVIVDADDMTIEIYDAYRE